MTEVRDRVATEVVGDLLKSNFEKFSTRCPDRIVDGGGEGVCCYHPDSATDCRFGVCPRMEIPLDESARILKREEPRGGDKLD